MKYVFLDLDNTLTDRQATVSAYAEYFLTQFRVCLKPEISSEYLSEAFNALDKGGYETHDARSMLISELGIWKETKTVKELSKHWQSWVPDNSLPMNGLYKCLNDLIDMGFKLCLVTNGQSKNQRAKIKKLYLDEYFEKIVISEEVGFKKPDSRIFKTALAEMECESNEAFFVGDHPVNDYLGSTELGFVGIWLEGSHSWPKDRDKPLSITSLNELCPLVHDITNKGTGC